jgi:hypothetical protein
MARLQRIRALAVTVADQKTIERCDRLMAKEQAAAAKAVQATFPAQGAAAPALDDEVEDEPDPTEAEDEEGEEMP